MKKLALILFCNVLLVMNIVNAQQNVGFGTTSPHASALLDMTATDKGLLIPRVTLLAINNGTAPVNNPATGLLVYNSAGSLEKGFYYWDGTQWVMVGAGGSSECTTLDGAYNCGGAGAGRIINANNGAVEIKLPSSGTDLAALYVESNKGASIPAATAGIEVLHTEFGAALFAEITKTTNPYPTVQAITNTSLTGTNISSGISGYHEGTGIGAGVWGEASSNSPAGASWGVKGQGNNKSFGGYFHSQSYPGLFAETNDYTSPAIQAAGAAQSPLNPGLLLVGWAQFKSGTAPDASGYGVNALINNAAGEITIAPDAGGYGGIGAPGIEWYGLFYYSATQASRRELKRDITYFDENVNSYLMNNIMAMKPSFYKYKSENDVKIAGNEQRTRYNMHMGFILDETPDFVQDNSFSGIDIYSLTTLGITGVQINRRDIDEIKEQMTEIFDFGTASLNGNEIFVNYNKDFQGSEPVVSVTPMSSVKDYYIKSQSSTGFTLAVEDANNFKFNWIAVASKPVKSQQSTPQIDAHLKSQLEVDQAKKQDIHKELFHEGPQKTVELKGADSNKYKSQKLEIKK